MEPSALEQAIRFNLLWASMVAAKLDDLVRTGQDLPPAAFAGEESRESRESSLELSFAQHVKQPGAARRAGAGLYGAKHRPS